MNAEHPLGEASELAALYVSGAMSSDEVDEFEKHLDAGCEVCRAEVRQLDAVAGALLDASGPVIASKNVRQRILSQIDENESAEESPQIWKHWEANAPTDALFIRRGADGGWEETGIAGVRVRHLFADQAADQVTMLVRMDPGTSYPRHVHGGPEECYVIQGDLRVGSEVLRAGDYQRAAAGSQHPVQSTDRGCLLLIVSSLSDELN